MTVSNGTEGSLVKTETVAVHFRGIDDAVATKERARSTTASRSHGGGVEHSGGVAAIKNLVEALDDRFQEAVDAVRARELEEGAQDLGRAEVVGWVGETGGVEEVDESFDCEDCVGEVELAGAGWGAEFVG